MFEGEVVVLSVIQFISRILKEFKLGMVILRNRETLSRIPGVNRVLGIVVLMRIWDVISL